MFDSYEQIFDERGQWYHEAMRHHPDARWREFRAVIDAADARPGETVVDLPAGGGYLAPWLRRGVRYVGVDSSHVFHTAAPRTEGARVLAPLHATGLPSASADVAVSLAGVHHLADRPALYREVARILRPGGRFVLADVRDGSDPARFLDVFVHAHNRLGHRGRYLDRADRAAITAAGLTITADRPNPYTWDFADEGTMASFVGRLFGLDRATPADVLRGIATHLGTDRGGRGVRMRWSLDVIVARAADAPVVDRPGGQ